MSVIRKILGPRSKYDRSLPYTYRARVAIAADGEISNDFFSDTVCGLIDFLHSDGFEPATVEILEVYQGKETVIDQRLYSTADGGWVRGPQLCSAFEKHYPGHIEGQICSFRDRDKSVAGN